MHNLRSGNENMFFPMVLITGAGRSGTGITGRILGSCKNTVFSYEPQWLSAISALMGTKELGDEAAKFLLEICIHDLEFYPQLIGRKVNLRPGYSSSFNYHSWDELLKRLALPDRRRDYDQIADREDLRFVFKMPDVHLVLGKLLDMFPQLKIVHLIRDGRDVIASGLGRKWYTDEFYRQWVVSWFKNGTDCPWFVEDRYASAWGKWTPVTRAAYGWCRMVTHGLENAKRYPERMRIVSYERFASNIDSEAQELACWCGLELTQLSKSHMQSLKNYEQVRREKHFDIDPSVKGQFEGLLRDLGY